MNGSTFDFVTCPSIVRRVIAEREYSSFDSHRPIGFLTA